MSGQRTDNALPLILTHGWPGSIIELLKVIDPLTNPTAHGGSASDAFHVVIPSMPGYGYSDKPRGPGWGPDHMATAWVELMKRLGYDRFAAQGGDWGAVVTDLMAAQAPPELIGMHTNMPGAIPPEVVQALPIPGQLAPGNPPPSGLSADEQRAFEQISTFYTKGAGYAVEMGTQPQTLYGVADSPVGLAAWMINHDAYSYGEITQAFDGSPVGELSRDEILDNIMLYWLTNTGVSSGRLYWDNKFGFFDAKNVSDPGGSERLPWRDLSRPAELGRAGLPQPHPLQRARPGRAFRGLGTAAASVRGGSRDVPDAALDDDHATPADALARRRNWVAQLRATRSRRAARPRRSRQLLDADLH